jgi:ATP-dependent 26S proteasome regulatory subunit
VESEFSNIVRHLDSIKKPDDAGFGLYTWSYTAGIVNVTDDPPTSIAETEDPLAMLDAFNKLPERSLLIARDFHAFLSDPNPKLVRMVKDALATGKMSNRVFVICGCLLKIPPELEKEMAVVEFKLPDRAQLRVVLEGIAASAGIPINGNTDPILDAASGCTTSEAEDAFALSVVQCGDIRAEIVAREKSGTVKKNGLLEIVDTDFNIGDIGGLEVLKSWLTKRRLAFSNEAKAYGLPVPKGILVTGIPGVGKSLTAKASAKILGVPLLKLDAGRIFGSLVGDSEKNIRAVIQTAEAIAPCVLMVDEIEKSFSGSKSSGSTDGGTSARVFGTFLSWLQDKTSPVFVFATANDISQLPPEFLRKGRFDDLWFADLPDTEERAAIWRLHINKRGRDADKFNLEMLAGRTDGFTGAEIEAMVNESLFASFEDGQRALNDDDLLEAIRNTVPLSRTMTPQIDALRAWSVGRARRASAIKDTSKGPMENNDPHSIECAAVFL